MYKLSTKISLIRYIYTVFIVHQFINFNIFFNHFIQMTLSSVECPIYLIYI